MIDLDGLTPFEATAELGEAVKALVALLREGGTIPEESIPGWIAGATVTALVDALGDER